MTKCKICRSRYNNRLRQFCPFCGACNPVIARMIGKIINRMFVEIVR